MKIYKMFLMGIMLSFLSMAALSGRSQSNDLSGHRTNAPTPTGQNSQQQTDTPSGADPSARTKTVPKETEGVSSIFV